MSNSVKNVKLYTHFYALRWIYLKIPLDPEYLYGEKVQIVMKLF